VFLLVAYCVTASIGVAYADEASDPGTVSTYADVLVETAVSDLDFPLHAVPDSFVGVLGTRVESIRKLKEFVAARRQAAIAAFAEAYRAAQLAAQRRPATSGSSSSCNGDFACFKACTLEIESHGNYAAVSPDGTYRGAWQFDQSTWDGAVARAGYPEWSGRDPATAPPGVQDAAAHQLYLERGNQPWGGRC
jgi:hypothetical protein